MKERPILFSGPMVRAILEGRKTQTRRAVKFQWCGSGEALMHQATFDPAYKCPYGQPGDRLWVRETFRSKQQCGETIDWTYRADCPALTEYLFPWKPSIHMPRRASRITLEIMSVRGERLQDISNEDCWKEGMYDATNPELKANRKWFSELWESLNGVGSWDLNQWVWVIEFKEVKP